ncbi:cytochrome c [Halomonas sp. PR-M31]|uniref:c-type cytochrome n=1 Tax=Halomonas sp. PR-M31 TaxID=1471202 RepID=UPI00069CFE1F|nr:cytochrome c [Halomonas sp. PR-M31]
MKNTLFTLLLLGVAGLSTMAGAQDDQTATQHRVTPEELKSMTDESAQSNGSAKTAPSVKDNEAGKSDEQANSNRARDAGERGTPPWTNDSANVNLKQPRTSPNKDQAKPYSQKDFIIKDEWKKYFQDSNSFSTTSGKELYHSLCQACHMPNGQGAEGAGIYPSFVGNERLRSPYYPIDVIVNGLRGMPGFGDMLSNEQIADVVGYLRTSFGNQLEADTTPDDVARVRHEQ